MSQDQINKKNDELLTYFFQLHKLTQEQLESIKQLCVHQQERIEQLEQRIECLNRKEA